MPKLKNLNNKDSQKGFKLFAKNKRKTLCVFTASRFPHCDKLLKQCQSISNYLANGLAIRNMQMVFGGGETGMMGYTANAVLEKDVPVIAVTAKELRALEPVLTSCSRIIVAKNIQNRKKK